MSADAGTPRVSIALCTYNGEKHLRQQLDSLLAQDVREVELVACDDASSDASFELLQAYAPRFAAARVMRNASTLGISANFERVFGECRGEWIAPCDQDDVWAPHKLSRLLAAADERSTLVYADSLLVDADDRPLLRRSQFAKVSDRYRMVQGCDARVFALANCISGHAALIRRSLVERARPLPQGVFYDAWLAFVAANLGVIHYVDEPLVRFRQHAGNASGFSGQRKHVRQSAREKWQAELRHLEAQAGFPGPQQAFFVHLLELWRERAQRRFTPALAAFLYRHRDQVFALKPSPSHAKWRHALKYLRGLKGRMGTASS